MRVHDLFNSVIIQDLYILVSHHLEHEFVACSPHGIACAHLFFSKDGITDPDLIQYCYKSFV